jgi:hypothetical protein
MERTKVEDPYDALIVPNLKKYEGKWVAIAKGKIVSADENPLQVMKTLRGMNLKEPPFITRVLEKNFVLY